MALRELKLEYQQGRIPSWELQERIHVQPFPSSRSHLHSLTPVPCFIFKASSKASF